MRSALIVWRSTALPIDPLCGHRAAEDSAGFSGQQQLDIDRPSMAPGAHSRVKSVLWTRHRRGLALL